MNVLIVDDSSIMRKQVSKCVRACSDDLMVDTATDGEDALKKFNEGSYDLVLTDWNMPKMDGITLLKELRKTHSLKQLPIFIITSEVARERIEEAVCGGAQGYIAKPFTEDSIKQKIQPFIER